MSLDWLSKAITCSGTVVCASIDPLDQLLPVQHQLTFRAMLLLNAWQAHHCDGRQLSYEIFDRWEHFEATLPDKSLTEVELRKLASEFGEFIFIPPRAVGNSIEIPDRALDWTLEEFDAPPKVDDNSI